MRDAPKAAPDPASEQRKADATNHRRAVADALGRIVGSNLFEVPSGPDVRSADRERVTLAAMEMERLTADGEDREVVVVASSDDLDVSELEDAGALVFTPRTLAADETALDAYLADKSNRLVMRSALADQGPDNDDALSDDNNLREYFVEAQR